LGAYPLYTKGEPREAVTVFDIVNGGGVLLPMRAGVEIPSKPLLMHWLAALASLVMGGVSEFSVRLPSATFAIAGLLVCYLYIRRLFDDVVALLAAVMMATSFQYLQSATSARVDMTLTFFMELAFFEFLMMAQGLTRRKMLLYFALALAVLTKGPVGLLLPAGVALAWIALERRWDMIGKLGLVRGAIIVLIIAGGWYVGAIIEGGPGFFRKQILAENLARFFGSADFHEGHQHPLYYMDMALLAGFLPWTLLLFVVMRRARRDPLPLNASFRYMMIWFAVVLVFYHFPQSKRGVYLLCLYPALATLVAIYVRETILLPERARRPVLFAARASGFVMTVVGESALAAVALLAISPNVLRGLLARVGIVAPRFVPMLDSAVGEYALLSVVLPIVAMAAGLFLLRTRPAIERVVMGVAGGMLAMVLVGNLIVVPAIANTLSLKDFTQHAMSVIGDSRAAYLGGLNYDFAFYSRQSFPIVTLDDPDLPEYLIGWRAIYDAMSPERRGHFTVVMVSNPTALDGSNEMVLLQTRAAPAPSLPKPEEGYIETMLSAPAEPRS